MTTQAPYVYVIECDTLLTDSGRANQTDCDIPRPQFSVSFNMSPVSVQSLISYQNRLRHSRTQLVIILGTIRVVFIARTEHATDSWNGCKINVYISNYSTSFYSYIYNLVQLLCGPFLTVVGSLQSHLATSAQQYN